MGLEIEWKFRVTKLPELPDVAPVRILQAYFDGPPTPAIRVRMKGGEGTINIKSAIAEAIGAGNPLTCHEFEYAIPTADAEELLQIAPFPVEKDRYLLPDGMELDVFLGRHEGLVVAELEVPEGGGPPSCPDGWEWEDVSQDFRYTNRWLAEHGIPD
jgi:CYTH domain-containing protein